MVNSDEAVIQDGHVAMTEAPGLGVELNEDFLQSMLQDGEPLWQYGRITLSYFPIATKKRRGTLFLRKAFLAVGRDASRDRFDSHRLKRPIHV